ncbi:MAG TPA: agmatinase [bacterium]|nr:agmatinase [bacterium]
MTFLAARAPGAGGSAGPTLTGVPYDVGSSFRRGSRWGPGAIRGASDSIETYNPLLDRDLEGVAFVDAGDLAVEALDPAAMVRAVRRSIGPGLPFLLGGEHTITLGGVQAVTARHHDVVVVQWDAHTDLRSEYQGAEVHHATVMRRLLDGGVPLVQLGIRAGTREEFALARRRSLHLARGVRLPQPLLDSLREKPLYLTVDIDVLDPSVAPGTGNPEPDGATYSELLTALTALEGHRIVGMDLVEVAPPWDPGGGTAIIAASLVRDMLLLFGTPAGERTPTGAR